MMPAITYNTKKKWKEEGTRVELQRCGSTVHHSFSWNERFVVVVVVCSVLWTCRKCGGEKGDGEVRTFKRATKASEPSCPSLYGQATFAKYDAPQQSCKMLLFFWCVCVCRQGAWFVSPSRLSFSLLFFPPRLPFSLLADQKNYATICSLFPLTPWPISSHTKSAKNTRAIL